MSLNKPILLLISSFIFFGVFIHSSQLQAFSQEAVPRSQYLDYAREAADYTWENYDNLMQRWKESFDPESVFGYRPPGGLLEMAVIYAYLYQQEKNPEYAVRSKKILFSYSGYRSAFPEWAREKRPDYGDGIPMLPDFFTVMRFLRAYDILKTAGALNAEEIHNMQNDIAHSMAYVLQTQEWGPMNRAALRTESLAWAVRALPNHPDAKTWEMQRKALGDDNWGNWQIEDATIYHAVWLYALLGYADAMGKQDELLNTPEMYYYAQYFLHLMCPAGMVPDFGDANWMANWARFLVFFETTANHFKDPQLKWAATTIARKFIDFGEPRNIGLAYNLLDCFLWGGDNIPVQKPGSLSQEVMEDVQGKKIVFRNGWDPDSTYLLLNYRDEGDGGLNFRDYLRDTIPVEEEKMTHGHADENSIILLMSGSSILLHDGGYRDYMPSGPYGAYRQDYFHNRLCVRQEKIWMGQNQGEFRYSTRNAVPGQSILDFLHNAGSYRKVRTQKVDFLSLDDFDYSRTRLTDDSMGYAWDRVIVNVKDPELYVVFDILKSLKEEYFTLANLWHTRKILDQGEHWYDTVYDKIQNHALPTENNLLILFPATHFRFDGTEPEKRHYQDEFLIHQTTAQHFELGETVGFITVLIPHPKDEPPVKWLNKIRVIQTKPDRAGLGVEIDSENRKTVIGVKNDLRMDMARDWRRPRYTYEAGKIGFGEFETNGDFLFASLHGSKITYTIVNLTKAFFKEKPLFEAKSSYYGLAYDASPDKGGLGKLRYWKDEVNINR
ncbi:MAG: hypothetical protein JSV17_15620 [Candidatus Aminicenantes bacterium]|nr:MAG: hypothetical protein JSV17_15620 [Candidatus Aminicenantes bacterium]